MRPDSRTGGERPPLKVLYLNHTAGMSGAERALLDLLEALPARFDPAVACPDAGTLPEAVRALGIRVLTVPEVRLSFRLHPVRTSQGVGELVRSALVFSRLARREQVALVHANSTRAGLITGLAVRLGGPPALVQVHDCLPTGPAGRLTGRVVGDAADLVVANSRHTAARLAQAGCRAPLRVVHNGVDADRFDPKAISRREARERLGLESDRPTLGLVAQLTPWKAQDDAIAILALLRETQPAARLLLVGSAMFSPGFSRYDNRAFERALRAAVSRLGLSDAVVFLDRRSDLPEILRALDLLILPSWEEPFGIALLEAMAMRLPVVATEVGGPSEIVTDGVDGFLLPPRRPLLWAEKIAVLLAQPELRAVVGERARRRAATAFHRRRYVDGIVACYSELLDRRGAAAA